MNLNIFKTVLCILIVATACKPKNFINENYNLSDVNKLQRELSKHFYEKKTGKYIYTKLGTTINLKKGKYNGEMSIIVKKDTLFYCVYQNNKPVGKYINIIYYGTGRGAEYLRILPINPKIDVGFGRGIFNQEHQKDGYWIDSNGSGNYTNGLKNGEWVRDYFNDVGGTTTKTKTIYKNDIVLSIKTVEERHGGAITGLVPKISNNMGLYNKQNQKEGYWEEDNRRYGEYINGLKNGVWTDYNVIQGKIIKTTIVYKNDVIISTVTEEIQN